MNWGVFFISWRFNKLQLGGKSSTSLVRSCRWDVWESADPRDPSWHRPSGFRATGSVCLHSRDCSWRGQRAGRAVSDLITHILPNEANLMLFMWNDILPRHCFQQRVFCSSMGSEMHVASSFSVSWTLPTAWAFEVLQTHTPAVTCSSLHTSTCCSTLSKSPRQRSSCSCRWNR